MSAPTEVTESQMRPLDRSDALRSWLDALAGGACDPADFLRRVDSLVAAAPDAIWESLALVDQYYRRRKIDPDLFRSLNVNLQSRAFPRRERAKHSEPATLTARKPIVIAAAPPAAQSEVATVPPAAEAQPTSARAEDDSPNARSEPAPVTARKPIVIAAAPPAAQSEDTAVPQAAEVRPTFGRAADESPNARSEPAPVTARKSIIIAAAPPATQSEDAVAPLTAAANSTSGRVADTSQSARSEPVPASASKPIVIAAAPSAPQSADATVPPTAAAISTSGRAPEAAPNARSHAAARRVWLAGDVVRGRYRLVRVLGQGTAGTTFEAIDLYRADLPDTSPQLAIKLLHREVSEQPEQLAELRRALCRQQSLAHPSILRVFDFDRDGDTAFFTMELLSGAPLDHVLARRNGELLERRLALSIVHAVGTALMHAHSRGVVHGDLRPHRVFLTDDGQVRVLGFGARAVEPGSRTRNPDAAQEPPGVAHNSAEGQSHADVAGSSDDLFSFASFAYTLLTGATPVANRAAVAAREARGHGPRPDVFTQRQWQVLRAALDPQAQLKDFLARLEPTSTSSPQPAIHATAPRRSRAGVLVAACAALAVVATAGRFWLNADPYERALAVERLSAAASKAFARASSLVRPARDAPPTSDDSRPAVASNVHPVALPDAVEVPAVPAARETQPTVRPPPRSTRPPRPPRPPRQSRPAAGPARVELAAATIDALPNEPAVSVRVRRSGNLSGDVSFLWWTESGTATPGDDFAGFPPHLGTIRHAADGVNLLIPIVSNSARQDAKSFYVMIDEVSPGASLGARTVTMITIPGAGQAPR
jgi:serine/threonine protein kinase